MGLSFWNHAWLPAMLMLMVAGTSADQSCFERGATVTFLPAASSSPPISTVVNSINLGIDGTSGAGVVQSGLPFPEASIQTGSRAMVDTYLRVSFPGQYRFYVSSSDLTSFALLPVDDSMLFPAQVTSSREGELITRVTEYTALTPGLYHMMVNFTRSSQRTAPQLKVEWEYISGSGTASAAGRSISRAAIWRQQMYVRNCPDSLLGHPATVQPQVGPQPLAPEVSADRIVPQVATGPTPIPGWPLTSTAVAVSEEPNPTQVPSSAAPGDEVPPASTPALAQPMSLTAVQLPAVMPEVQGSMPFMEFAQMAPTTFAATAALPSPMNQLPAGFDPAQLPAMPAYSPPLPILDEPTLRGLELPLIDEPPATVTVPNPAGAYGGYGAPPTVGYAVSSFPVRRLFRNGQPLFGRRLLQEGNPTLVPTDGPTPLPIRPSELFAGPIQEASGAEPALANPAEPATLPSGAALPNIHMGLPANPIAASVPHVRAAAPMSGPVVGHAGEAPTPAEHPGTVAMPGHGMVAASNPIAPTVPIAVSGVPLVARPYMPAGAMIGALPRSVFMAGYVDPEASAGVPHPLPFTQFSSSIPSQADAAPAAAPAGPESAQPSPSREDASPAFKIAAEHQVAELSSELRASLAQIQAAPVIPAEMRVDGSAGAVGPAPEIPVAGGMGQDMQAALPSNLSFDAYQLPPPLPILEDGPQPVPTGPWGGVVGEPMSGGSPAPTEVGSGGGTGGYIPATPSPSGGDVLEPISLPALPLSGPTSRGHDSLSVTHDAGSLPKIKTGTVGEPLIDSDVGLALPGGVAAPVSAAAAVSTLIMPPVPMSGMPVESSVLQTVGKGVLVSPLQDEGLAPSTPELDPTPAEPEVVSLVLGPVQLPAAEEAPAPALGAVTTLQPTSETIAPDAMSVMAGSILGQKSYTAMADSFIGQKSHTAMAGVTGEPQGLAMPHDASGEAVVASMGASVESEDRERHEGHEGDEGNELNPANDMDHTGGAYGSYGPNGAYGTVLRSPHYFPINPEEDQPITGKGARRRLQANPALIRRSNPLNSGLPALAQDTHISHPVAVNTIVTTEILNHPDGQPFRKRVTFISVMEQEAGGSGQEHDQEPQVYAADAASFAAGDGDIPFSGADVLLGGDEEPATSGSFPHDGLIIKPVSDITPVSTSKAPQSWLQALAHALNLGSTAGTHHASLLERAHGWLMGQSKQALPQAGSGDEPAASVEGQQAGLLAEETANWRDYVNQQVYAGLFNDPSILQQQKMGGGRFQSDLAGAHAIDMQTSHQQEANDGDAGELAIWQDDMQPQEDDIYKMLVDDAGVAPEDALLLTLPADEEGVGLFGDAPLKPSPNTGIILQHGVLQDDNVYDDLPDLLLGNDLLGLESRDYMTMEDNHPQATIHAQDDDDIPPPETNILLQPLPVGPVNKLSQTLQQKFLDGAPRQVQDISLLDLDLIPLLDEAHGSAPSSGAQEAVEVQERQQPSLPSGFASVHFNIPTFLSKRFLSLFSSRPAPS